MVSTDLSFLFANKTAESLATSRLAQMQPRSELSMTWSAGRAPAESMRQVQKLS